MSKEKILIYGYGNIGRQDDGLGIYFAQIMEDWAREKGIENIFFETNYQLNIEDSLLLADMDIVLFADASKSGHSFNLKKLTCTETISSFSTHKISPETVMTLCNNLYNKSPLSYLFTIKGYRWEFNMQISKMAQKNLDMATLFLQNEYLKNRMVNITKG